jgi:uncharacterized membrane protein
MNVHLDIMALFCGELFFLEVVAELWQIFKMSIRGIFFFFDRRRFELIWLGMV